MKWKIDFDEKENLMGFCAKFSFFLFMISVDAVFFLDLFRNLILYRNKMVQITLFGNEDSNFFFYEGMSLCLQLCLANQTKTLKWTKSTLSFNKTGLMNIFITISILSVQCCVVVAVFFFVYFKWSILKLLTLFETTSPHRWRD